jgi:hypothetical protein
MIVKSLMCGLLLGLGYAPKYEVNSLPPFHQGQQRFMIVARHPRVNTELAYLDYSLLPDGDSAVIEKVEVLNENNFRKGLSTALIQVMMEAHPQISQVEFVMADVNRRIFNKTLDLSQTPTGRAALELGFQLVGTESSFETGEYKFVMAREPLH